LGLLKRESFANDQFVFAVELFMGERRIAYD
jgi:hypothetical protein